jgi:hypothetical protein
MGMCATTSATAADSTGAGFFTGVDLGAAQYPERNVALDLGSDVLSSRNQQRSDFAWAASVGYLATRYVGWEAAYHDFGTTSAHLAGASASSNGSVELASQGTTLAFVGTVPFGKWEADWKLGYLFAHTSLTASGNVPAGAFQANAAAKSQKPFVALGLGYNLTDHWNTGLSFADYTVGSDETGKVHVITAAFSAAYRF